MLKLESSPEDAPVHYRADAAYAWACGHDAGVIEAIAACADLAAEHGGADGLIISEKIRNILLSK